MEERLQKALEFSNYRQTLNNQLHKAKVKAEGMLIFAEAGGTFIIDQQLICFLDYLVKEGYTEAPLLDSNKSPIHITDIPAFLQKVTARYFEVTNDYLKDAQAIKKSRKVSSILDLKEE